MEKIDAASDSRMIPGGKLLRATGLDELPQLLNVFRGEMSLVGPRPCVPYEYELYRPQHRGRFAAVPGLTGLWQVSGKNRTTFEQMIGLDLQYIRRKSWWLDLTIMLRTPAVILGQVWEARSRRQKLAARSSASGRCQDSAASC